MGGLGSLGGLSSLTSNINLQNMDTSQASTIAQSGMSAFGNAVTLLQEPETADLLQQGTSAMTSLFSGDMQGAMSSGMSAFKDVAALAQKDETKELVGNAATAGFAGAKMMAPAFGVSCFDSIDPQQAGSTVQQLYGQGADVLGQFSSQMG